MKTCASDFICQNHLLQVGAHLLLAADVGSLAARCFCLQPLVGSRFWSDTRHILFITSEFCSDRFVAFN